MNVKDFREGKLELVEEWAGQYRTRAKERFASKIHFFLIYSKI